MNHQAPLGPGQQPGPARRFEEFGLAELEQSVPQRFEQQVARYPNRLAARGARGQFHLPPAKRRREPDLARHPGPAGTGRRAGWGNADNDALAVAAILGILKAGKGYVPLDPALPRDRLAYFVSGLDG